MRARHAHTIKIIKIALNQVKRAKKALHENAQRITGRTVIVDLHIFEDYVVQSLNCVVVSNSNLCLECQMVAEFL